MEALRSLVELQQPGNLTEFLAGFQYTAPALAGDLAAIERVAWEFCEVTCNSAVAWTPYNDKLSRTLLSTACSMWREGSARTFSWMRRTPR